ncbi:MAG: SIS domain-containing protein [Nitrospirae bacterium]|nr:SIS domain-containing protein [Nitrospirota bacterium]
MRKFAENYYSSLFNFASSIRVTNGSSGNLTFPDGIEIVGNLIISQVDSGKKIIFIGNGGSAAIASHMAVDFWKNGGMKAVSFNDGPQLTCIGNDYGYKHVFEKPIAMFADEGDVLVAISSSGRSENILLGVQAAKSKGCRIITISGFDENNPLASLGEINFHVPSKAYGPVEVLHHSICHCIIDTIMKAKNG